MPLGPYGRGKGRIFVHVLKLVMYEKLYLAARVNALHDGFRQANRRRTASASPPCYKPEPEPEPETELS